MNEITGNNLERGGRGLMEVLYGYLPGGTEEHDEVFQ
jgi:hypothetical protein